MSEVDLGIFGYDIDRQRRGLKQLHDRYFRKVIAHPDGRLTHHGDCQIYRSFGEEYDDYQYAYCSCGFFHDLRWLDCGVTDKLYDKTRYYEELGREVGRKPGDPPAISEEEYQKCMQALEDAGMKKVVATPEQEAAMNERDWKLIAEVFGDAFTNRRKEEWQKLEDAEASV